MVFPLVVSGQTLTQFQNGQVADADEINANFNALKQAIEAVGLSERIDFSR